jgi:hypothetical protein
MDAGRRAMMVTGEMWHAVKQECNEFFRDNRHCTRPIPYAPGSWQRDAWVEATVDILNHLKAQITVIEGEFRRLPKEPKLEVVSG